jgi:hypothetical protein
MDTKHNILFHSPHCIETQKLVEYASGNLTATEMHYVERHLMDCSMCSDALEGIYKLDRPDSLNDIITELNAAIDQRVTKRNSISIGYVMRVAASLLVLLSISMLTYNYFLSINSTYTLAENLHRRESVWAGKQLIDEQPFSESPVSLSISRPGVQTSRPAYINKSEVIAMAQSPDKSIEIEKIVFDLEDTSDDSVLEEVVVIGYGIKKKINSEDTMSPISTSQASSGQTITLAEATAAKKDEGEKARAKITKSATADPQGKALGNSAENDNLLHSAVNMQPAKEQHLEEVYLIAEEMPLFTAEGYTNFNHFIAKNINLQHLKQEVSMGTTVYVEFIIETDGRISNAKALRNGNNDLELEAVRVIMLSPKWTPGKQRGVPVRVALTYPIKFDFQ